VSNAFYQDELQYLREVGPDFARINPEIARFLADPSSNPDIERFLEGVAFLCGRIRQKLDDDLPELTQSVMSLLWPHYLQPIPSMSILEFLPDIDGMQGPLLVPPGAEFASAPVQGTRCRYRSTWPTVLRPWVLREARLETEAARPVRLVVTLQSAAHAKLENLDLQSVRFHLAGDPRTKFTLYLLLSAHVETITVSDGSNRHGRPETTLPADRVQPAGFTRAEATLPYPPHSFPGYRLLQEYFAFKDRFLFVDLKGLDETIAKLKLTNTIQIAFTFNRRLDSLPLVSRENVRLHCAPIVNLFAQPAEPIRVRHDRVQYLVRAARSGIAERSHAEIHSVSEVRGLVRGEGLDFRLYQPFYSFDHMLGGDPRAATYYQLHLAPAAAGDRDRESTETHISFVVGGKSGATPPEETISIELECTNGRLPDSLNANDICEPTDRSPLGVRFRNLSKPTVTVNPPLGRGLHWRLISHMSLNYVSLTDAAHLKELLRVYDFQSAYDVQRAHAQQRLLDGIQDVRATFKERMVRGAPLRGVRVDLKLHEDHFAGEGDAYLFASVMDRFLGLYATLNGFSELHVLFAKSQQPFAFAPRWGEQITPADARPSGVTNG